MNNNDRVFKILMDYTINLGEHNIKLIKENYSLSRRVKKLEILLKQHEIQIPEEEES